MSFLWGIDALMAAVDGRPVGEMPEGISGISIDTRTLEQGDAFFAIKGDRVDGHDYLVSAMRAGAAVAVVDESKLVSLGSLKLPLIVVRDVLEAMTRLGEVARMRSKARIIAITGSVGKTTTKEMLRTVLSPSGLVHASVASFNNHWGVPLTLARMPEEAKFGVFEIGMNHAGEITPLVKMVRPHVAMITAIAPAHIGAFETIEDIAKAKAEIYSGVVPGGYGLINHDDRRYTLLRDLAGDAGIEHLASYGQKRGSDFWLRELEKTADGSSLSVRVKGQDVDYEIAIPGEHMALNSVGVLGAAVLLGADLDKSCDALSKVTPADGRGTRYVVGGSGAMGITIIDESYNANPASMEAALEVLGNYEGVKTKRRIAVLGDMLELGRQSRKYHEALAKPISASRADLVFLVGPEMEYLAKILPKEKLGGYYKDAGELGSRLKATMKPGDVFMLKASKGIGFAAVVQSILE
ncbi:MAG: UDP-N-acetylmuramoylalanyl-D-glutamyl-2,6-diaminopimelate--D-alanyl-D-alanine ligase [Pseudomonadota bacterium]